MEKSSDNRNQYTRDALTKERFKLRNRIDRVTAIPFAALGLIWLNLLILFIIHRIDGFLEGTSAIWILFQADLLLKIYLSPSAGLYFRKNPFQAASAILPFLRILTLLKYLPMARKSRRNYPQKAFNS